MNVLFSLFFSSCFIDTFYVFSHPCSLILRFTRAGLPWLPDTLRFDLQENIEKFHSLVNIPLLGFGKMLSRVWLGAGAHLKKFKLSHLCDQSST